MAADSKLELVSESELLRRLNVSQRRGNKLRANGSLEPDAVANRTRLFRRDRVPAIAAELTKLSAK